MKSVLKLAVLLFSIPLCNAQPFVTNTVTNGIWTLQAVVSITSPGASDVPVTVPATKDGSTINKVIFKSEEEITLKPGFSATSYEAGNTSMFHAYLVPPLMFAELKDVVDGSYCTTIDNNLCFRYIEKYDQGVLNYRIFNYKNQEIISGNTPGFSKPIRKGSNFIKLNLDPELNIQDLIATNNTNCFYLLEVKNGKGDRYVLRFKYLPL